MTTSGSVNFSISRDQIIKDAFIEAGIFSPIDTLKAEDLTYASRKLNMMIKAWQAAGVGLWLNQTVTLPLAYQTQSYDLGPTGDNCSAAMIETTLSADSELADSSITVTDDTGMAAAQYIGIELDDGTMQWTTIASAPGAYIINLSSALTNDASADNVVFAYTTKINRPLGIVEARLRDKDGLDTPMAPMARREYMELSLKSTTGKPSQYYYDPQTGLGVFYLWPTADTVSDRVVMTVKTPIQDFDSTADTPDFPQEWYDALVCNLAAKLSPAYRVPLDEFARLKGLAKEAFDMANDFDREDASSFFSPAPRR